MPNPTRAAIAAALGVDRSIISRWAKRGMALYSIEAARTWRAQNIRPRIVTKGAIAAQPSGIVGGNGHDVPDSTALRSARRRREEAQAEMAELELRRIRGELCRAADVSRAASLAGAAIAAASDTLVARASAALGPGAYAILRLEVDLFRAAVRIQS